MTNYGSDLLLLIYQSRALPCSNAKHILTVKSHSKSYRFVEMSSLISYNFERALSKSSPQSQAQSVAFADNHSAGAIYHDIRLSWIYHLYWETYSLVLIAVFDINNWLSYIGLEDQVHIMPIHLFAIEEDTTARLIYHEYLFCSGYTQQ